MAGDASLGIEDRSKPIGGGVEDLELGLPVVKAVN